MLSILQQTLVFLPLVLGIYFSFSILKVVDLTVDGSFVLGAAVFASSMVHGNGELISVCLAVMSGFFCGVAVALLQTITKINALIASILAVFMLYSINLAIMGRPNINLLRAHMHMNALSFEHPFLFFIIFVMAMLVFLGCFCRFLHSQYGLQFRAFGANPTLLRALGKYPVLYLVFGLGISNALAGLCGVLTAEMNGYADVNMGLGMALTAIGAVIVGQKLVGRVYKSKYPFSALKDVLGCFIGALLYFSVLSGLLRLGVNPIYLKLCLGLVLVSFISLSQFGRGEFHYEKQYS